MLIRGRKVALRRAQPEDAERAYEWLALSELTPFAFGPPLYPELPVPTRAGFDARYPPSLFEAGNPYDGRALVIAGDNEDLGLLVFGAVRLPEGAVEMELWLADRRCCGRGFGSEALRLACAWLQVELGVDNFVLRASRRNVRALRAFRRAGFRSAGNGADAARRFALAPHPLADCEVLLASLPPPAVELRCERQRTYVFLDSEFTQLREPRLISVGAVATDATAFYCEVGAWPREQASDFVLQVVAPRLDGDAVPHPVAGEALARWLGQRAARQPVTVISDSLYDRWALADLLGTEYLPAAVRWQRVPLPYEKLDAVVAEMGLRRHHALDDARGLRQALLHPSG
jgi:RimJ/RimL family protein N-acetyltransferase